MAVIYAGGRGGGLLGTLGTLAGMMGTLTGTPWLSALGMGANAANSAMNGNAGGLADALSGIVNGEFGGMQNPAAGNIARTDEANAAANVAQAMNLDAGYPPVGKTMSGPVPNSVPLEEYLPPVGQTGTGQNMIVPPVGQTFPKEDRGLYEPDPEVLLPPVDYSLSPLAQKAIETLKIKRWNLEEYPYLYPYLEKIPQDTRKHRRIRGY